MMVDMSYEYEKQAAKTSMENAWKVDVKWLLRQAFMAFLEEKKEIFIGVAGKKLYFEGISFPQDSLNAEEVMIEEIPPWP
jgi:hypothetical protein